MKVKALADALSRWAQEHPEAEVKIDPPYSEVISAEYRADENVVEINH